MAKQTTDPYQGLGLAYPGHSDIPSSINLTDFDYVPIFTRMIKDKLISSGIFSIAVDMDTGGKMAFGGIPQGVKYEDRWFKAPLQGKHTRTLDIKDMIQENTPYYNISMSFAFPGADKVAGYPGHPNNTFFALIDSGASEELIPLPVLEALAKAIDPPAHIGYSPGQDAYLLDMACSATFPEYGYTIGGETLYWKKEDWFPPIRHNASDDQPCRLVCQALGVKTGINPLVTLSATNYGLLQKMLAVFDVEKSEVSFAPRC